MSDTSEHDCEADRPEAAAPEAPAVSRRAVLGAAVLTAGLSASCAPNEDAASPADPNYPPAMQGMRGQNDASFQYAHAVRDGYNFEDAQDTGEVYDLVVVGAGMSGLAAAYFYRKWLPEKRVLILDNCDDFGGHARRNEFVVDGKLALANGGAVLVLWPNTYSPAGKMLMADVGLNSERFLRATEKDLSLFSRLHLSTGVFFDREDWGVDKLVAGYPGLFVTGDYTPPQSAEQWRSFLQQAPVSAQTGQDLLRIATEVRDNLSGLSIEQKVDRLRRMSYAAYLTEIMGVSPDTVKLVRRQFDNTTNTGTGADSFSAWLAYRAGLGGFQGMGLPSGAQAQSNIVGNEDLGGMLWLPDGMGGFARLIVRWLIPAALPGSTMEDAVTAQLNYAALDAPANAVRLRLNSTVVRAKHVGGDPQTSQAVTVTYMKDGVGYQVMARGVVMACFNAMVPYLCPELPAPQKQALHSMLRKPLAVINVAVRNWAPFVRAGVSQVETPGSMYSRFYLTMSPSFGRYKRAERPREPTIVQFAAAWEQLGLPIAESMRAGRAELLGLDQSDFETAARDQLQRAFGGFGFDADRDIAGVMVNRWGHGLIATGGDLYHPEWTRDEAPWVRGRRRFGLIAIANSDAGAVALTQGAFDQAHRAVTELMNDVIRPYGDLAQAGGG